MNSSMKMLYKTQHLTFLHQYSITKVHKDHRCDVLLKMNLVRNDVYHIHTHTFNVKLNMHWISFSVQKKMHFVFRKINCKMNIQNIVFPIQQIVQKHTRRVQWTPQVPRNSAIVFLRSTLRWKKNNYEMMYKFLIEVIIMIVLQNI